jgi:iron complex outermembrane recepter protein
VNKTESNKSLFISMIIFRNIIAIALFFCFGYVYQQNLWAKSSDLSHLSIEELMNIQITTLSKKTEQLSSAPAAVYVVTSEDIHRSGYSNIPDILRLVPGLEVASIDLSAWAITARGFNGQFASKLLVLIDGRSVYSPLFSGVFWDINDIMLEDIDRIEVVRGPGATMWGANAVNGVINIITKSSKQTQGLVLTTSAGIEKKYGGALRYGGKLGSRTTFRIYSKGFSRTLPVKYTSSGKEDYWDQMRGGFRLDSDPNLKSNLSVSANVFSGKCDYSQMVGSITPPYAYQVSRDAKSNGVDILARYTYSPSSMSDYSLQFYYDYTDNDIFIGKDIRSNFDLDFQHRWSAINRNEFVWGLGFRASADKVNDTEMYDVEPQKETSKLISGFVQDEIDLWKHNLQLTLGSKFEYNDYTKTEIQPSARLTFSPVEHHTIWSAVSRAVRTPSRGERDGKIILSVIPPNTPMNPTPLPIQIDFIGNHQFVSEELTAYEMGYRVQPAERLSFSAAGFFNRYDHLRNAYQEAIQQVNGSTVYFVLPMYLENNGNGNTSGAELSAEWRPANWWRLQGSYTYLESDLNEATHGASSTNPGITEDIIPHHQAVGRSSFDINKYIQVDIIVRYVDKLANSSIRKYIATDFRLAWKAADGLELYVNGQNIGSSAKYEFDSTLSLQAMKAKTIASYEAGLTWTLPSHMNPVKH